MNDLVPRYEFRLHIQYKDQSGMTSVYRSFKELQQATAEAISNDTVMAIKYRRLPCYWPNINQIEDRINGTQGDDGCTAEETLALIAYIRELERLTEMIRDR